MSLDISRWLFILAFLCPTLAWKGASPIVESSHALKPYHVTETARIKNLALLSGLGIEDKPTLRVN